MREGDLSDAFAHALGELTPEARRVALEAFARAMFGATIPGSGSYQRTTREEAPGAAYSGADERWAEAYSKRQREAFEKRDWGDWASKVHLDLDGVYRTAPRPTIDRNVIARARSLQRMIAGTGYEGERTNAQAALGKLMAKHGFTERDL